MTLPDGKKAFFKSQKIHELDLNYASLCEPSAPDIVYLPGSIIINDYIKTIEPSRHVISTKIPSKSHEYDDFVYETIKDDPVEFEVLSETRMKHKTIVIFDGKVSAKIFDDRKIESHSKSHTMTLCQHTKQHLHQIGED